MVQGYVKGWIHYKELRIVLEELFKGLCRYSNYNKDSMDLCFLMQPKEIIEWWTKWKKEWKEYLMVLQQGLGGYTLS